MFGLPLFGWIGIGMLVTILALGVGLKVEASRLATSKAETVAVQGKFDTFVAQTKALGEEQAAKAKATDLINQQYKEQADANVLKARSELTAAYADYRRLRNSAGASSGRGQMPAAPSVTSSAARTCFDTAKFADAMGVLETGVPNIIEQGDAAIVDLNAAKGWALKLKLATSLSP